MRTQLWTNDINDPNEMTLRELYYPLIQNNHSFWRNEKVEALFLQSQQEMDAEKRAVLYQQIQEIYLAEAAIIIVLDVPYPVCLSKKVHDFVQIPLGNNIFVDTYLA